MFFNATLTINDTRSAADAGDFAGAVLDQGRQMGYTVKGYTVSDNKNSFQ